ncbi:MAG: type II toxin-antitoxin system VapC family toxin [Thiohalomonadales bacterium]
MTGFVLDNSIAMRWLLSSTKTSDQKYAENILISLPDVEAVVPSFWRLEVSNVLLGAERRSDINQGDSETFLIQLELLPIHVDSLTQHQAFSRIISIARSYKLTSYDASYLELALREGLPLATLDRDLLKAAKKANVQIYLK